MLAVVTRAAKLGPPKMRQALLRNTHNIYSVNFTLKAKALPKASMHSDPFASCSLIGLELGTDSLSPCDVV